MNDNAIRVDSCISRVSTVNEPQIKKGLLVVEIGTALISLCSTRDTAVVKLLLSRLVVASRQNATALIECQLTSALQAQLCSDRLENIRATLCAMRQIFTKSSLSSLRCSCLEVGVHASLARLLQRDDLRNSDVDSICTHLTQLLVNQPTSLHLDVYRDKGVANLLLHLGSRPPVLYCLSELLRCNSANRYILRDAERARVIFEFLRSCIDCQNCLGAAVDVLTRLLDNDIIRSSSVVDKNEMVLTLLPHLAKSQRHILRLVRSLVGRGTTSFIGQMKQNKLPDRCSVEEEVVQWCRALSVRVLVALPLQKPYLRLTIQIIDTVCCHINIEALQARSLMHDLASAVQDCDKNTLHMALQAMMQLCLASRLTFKSEVSASLLTPCKYLHSYPRLFCFRKENEVDKCSICLESSSDCESTCAHSFHRRCISRWLRQNPSCPVCRSSGLDVVKGLFALDLFSVGTP